MEMTYDHQEFILLPYNHQFTKLHAEHIHDNYYHMGAGASRKFHSDISSTIAKIRSCYWVTNLTNLNKSICHKCIRCKIDNQKVEKQSMGKLPVERLKPNSGWSNTSLDFFRTIYSKR